MKIPIISSLKGPQFTEKHFQLHYPEFWEYLNYNYPPDIKFQEKIYWYFNNINDYPVCPVCGGRLKLINAILGYQTTCSKKCSNKYDKKKEKIKNTTISKYGGVGFASKIIYDRIKDTNINRYGTEFIMHNKEILKKTQDTCKKRYGGQGNASSELKKKQINTCKEKYGVENYGSTTECRNKMMNTCRERYGVDSYSKTKEFRDKIISHNKEKYGVNSYTQTLEYAEKALNTNLKKYNETHYSKTQEYKDIVKKICFEKYGVDNYSKTDEFKIKNYNTKKQNHTFNTSKIEIEFKQYLENNHIPHIYQYRSDLYPFSCDFYFPDKDIYLEIDASWTHGGHLFDPNNKDDQNILDLWKSHESDYYKKAIETWTIRDPEKHRIAEKNKIKLYNSYYNDLNNTINFCKINNII